MSRRHLARAKTITPFVIVALVAAGMFWRYFVQPVALPAPSMAEPAAQVSFTDFVGAERCAKCHVAEYAVWERSTHGRAGGPASPALVIAPFNGTQIRFADAVVTPRVRDGIYEFIVAWRDEPPRALRVDGVVGGATSTAAARKGLSRVTRTARCGSFRSSGRDRVAPGSATRTHGLERAGRRSGLRRVSRPVATGRRSVSLATCLVTPTARVAMPARRQSRSTP